MVNVLISDGLMNNCILIYLRNCLNLQQLKCVIRLPPPNKGASPSVVFKSAWKPLESCGTVKNQTQQILQSSQFLVIILLWFNSPVNTRRNKEKWTIVTDKQAKTLQWKVIIINSEKPNIVQKTVSNKDKYSESNNGKKSDWRAVSERLLPPVIKGNQTRIRNMMTECEPKVRLYRELR